MKIYIGGDHTGFEVKEQLKTYLKELGHDVEDKGPFSYDKEDDYPDFVRPVAEAVVNDKESLGVVLGGSGQGEAMCANRVHGARAAVFYGEALAAGVINIEGEKSSDPYEIVKLARMHNNANILSLSMRFLTIDQIKFAVELFVATKFEGGERHVRRINKLD